MSSGPGKLQNQILDALSHEDAFVFQRKILWDIANDRNEISITDDLCDGIKCGKLKRSFENSFRISAKRLIEKEIIELKEEKITNLNMAVDYFPFCTSSLEIHILRNILLPTIKDYILSNNETKIGPSEIEDRQMKTIRRTKQFKSIRKQWNTIESGIIEILHDNRTTLSGAWIECLVRGRYLFVSAKIRYIRALYYIIKELKKSSETSKYEESLLKKLDELFDDTFDKEEWNLGIIKGDYFKIGNFVGRGDVLHKEVKEYLFEKHKDLLIMLPGHKEPLQSNGRWSFETLLEKRKYSSYLDRLVTKQIFKKQRLIKLC